MPGNESESTVSRAASFFTSVPGILTGLAALVTAVAGVLGVLNTTGSNDGGSNGGAGGGQPVASVSATEDDDRSTGAIWAQEADALCISFSQQIENLGEPQDAFELADYLAAAIALSRTFVSEIGDLTPARGDEVDAERMIGLLERAVDSFDSALSSLRNGDEVTANQLVARALDTNGRASEIARQLGADKCAET